MFDAKDAAQRIVLHLARFSGAAPLLAGTMGGIGAILMLHRVMDERHGSVGVNRHLAITPGFLDVLISEMKRIGYEFVSMDEAVELIHRGRARPRFVTITADDAYRDNLTQALPVLESHGVPLTIYACPGLTDRTIDLWWDVLEEIVARSDTLTVNMGEVPRSFDCSTLALKARANREIHDHVTTALPEGERQAFIRELAKRAGVGSLAGISDTLMDWDDVRQAAAYPLVTIGAHTMSHYMLRRLSDAEARDEIVRAAEVIEAETGVRPRHMAYPYGYERAVGEREVGLAREAGFVSAVTTRHGVIKPAHSHHLHALPRISLNGRYQSLGHVRTMLSGVTTPLANAGRNLVTV